MTRLIVLILLLLPAMAPAKWPTQLWSCDMWPPLQSYMSHVDVRIGAPNPRVYEASFTAYPSFQPEWGVRLSGHNSRPVLKVVVLLDSISGRIMDQMLPRQPRTWASYQPEAQRLVFRFVVSGQLASLLSTAVRQAVAARAREESFPGIDGIGYRFFDADGICAGTWSPGATGAPSIPALLVQIFGTLKTMIYARDPQARARIENEAIADLRRLVAQQ